MAVETQDFRGVFERLRAPEEKERMDLSADEDLCVGIMNLISIEEHLFFTGAKTGKDDYFGVLNTVRQIRKELMKLPIQEYEGEAWCIEKHLLAASMRLMEVGTKRLQTNDIEGAKDLFTKSFTLYSTFWAVKFKAVGQVSISRPAEKPPEYSSEQQTEFNRKLCQLVGEGINCCVE